MDHAEHSSSRRRFGKPDLERMGRFLRDERKARSLSVRALGEASGLSAGAIRALEAGQANSSLATVLAVVEALDVDLDEAIEAARVERRKAVVHRAGDEAAEPLPGAALNVESAEILAKSVGPAPEANASHPGMGLVVEGSLVAVLGDGKRHRLEKGDVYHAQPRVVQGLAGVGTRPARLMLVTDTRRTDDRPAPLGETRN